MKALISTLLLLVGLVWAGYQKPLARLTYYFAEQAGRHQSGMLKLGDLNRALTHRSHPKRPGEFHGSSR
jgi:hypothetical protein